MTPGVSVVICTYNGSKRIPETLRHMALQKVTPGILWEVILVDNGSTDNSSSIATQEWEKYGCPVPFSVKYQPEPGLTAAREAGIANAQYEYVVLCDDDNWLSASYVDNVFISMQANKLIGVMGGNGELIYEEPPPAWLISSNLLAGGKQAPQSGKVKSNIVYGASCVVRKSAYSFLQQKGFRFLLTDRTDTNLASGGDHELCYALTLARFEVWCNEQLKFRHFITRERTNWNYFLKFVRESSYCFDVLEPYKILVKIGRSNTFLFWTELFRSFIYHVIRFLPALFRRIIYSSKTEKGRSYLLKYIILKTRLVSYKRYKIMKANFHKIAALKDKLQEGQ